MTTLDKTAWEASLLRLKRYHWDNRQPGMFENENGAFWQVAAVLRALSSLPAQAVGVKALEWRKWDKRDNGGSADTIVGHYHVWTHHEANGRWFWRLSTTGLGPIAVQGECATEDEAKAAAQADYEARIRSALRSTP